VGRRDAGDRPAAHERCAVLAHHFTSSFLKFATGALFRQNALFRREALGNFRDAPEGVAPIRRC